MKRTGPSALLDTTVFCGALVKPTGGNMRLLTLGATPLYRPIISQAVIAEFIHKVCGDGIGKGPRIYTPEEIRRFLDSLSGIMDPNQSERIRRTYRFVSTMPQDTPLSVLISKVVYSWPTDDKVTEILGHPIGSIDLGDLHLIAAAVQTHPDFLVTSNQKDAKFLEPLCQVVTPREFLIQIGSL